MKALALLALGLIPVVATAAETRLQPLLAVPDQIVLKDDFSKPAPLKKEHWGARQGTRWTIEDGVLRGRPSTPEYQAKRKDHKGFEPRISAPITPPQFIAEFSVRFSGGSETAAVPFIEFGHHVCRVHLGQGGTEVLADHETTRVAEAKDFKYEAGRWYRVLAEMKGDEFVIQFADGPTFYAKHECFTKPAPSGGNGLGVTGPKDGLAEIDNLTLWSVKSGTQPGWEAARAKLPQFTPVAAKTGPAPKAAKKK
ncbi:MAG: hypothetical protein WCS99_03290 [Limisphaerales bacterium]